MPSIMDNARNIPASQRRRCEAGFGIKHLDRDPYEGRNRGDPLAAAIQHPAPAADPALVDVDVCDACGEQVRVEEEDNDLFPRIARVCGCGVEVLN